MATMQERIDLVAADGHRFAANIALPKTKARSALVLVQEIFGVNSHIRALADGFAAEGYLVIAPALFDRVERSVELGYGPEDIQRGRTLKEASPIDKAPAGHPGGHQPGAFAPGACRARGHRRLLLGWPAELAGGLRT